MELYLDGPLPGYGRADGQSGGRHTLADIDTAQTLTNKTLSAPTITNPTFTTLTPANITTTPVTLGSAHKNRLTTISLASGGVYTLPAATGSGDIYRICVAVSLTSGTLVFAVANASDYLRGQLSTIGASGITIALTANTGTVATESDTVTWNRSTTGLGTQGDYIEFEDVAANVWRVDALYASSGAAATPFSAAV